MRVFSGRGEVFDERGVVAIEAVADVEDVQSELVNKASLGDGVGSAQVEEGDWDRGSSLGVVNIIAAAVHVDRVFRLRCSSSW